MGNKDNFAAKENKKPNELEKTVEQMFENGMKGLYDDIHNAEQDPLHIYYEAMENEKIKSFHKRKGKIRLNMHFFRTMGEQELKTVFSNFFPMSIEQSHNFNFYDTLWYYGLSPHFDEIEQEELIPEYTFQMSEIDGIFVFEKMERID